MKKFPNTSPVTRKRLETFYLPNDQLESELLKIAEVFNRWKIKPDTPKGCLNGAFIIRTNFHRIPHGRLRDFILSALEGTDFRFSNRNRFSSRKKEQLWKDSIHLGEYMRSLSQN